MRNKLSNAALLLACALGCNRVLSLEETHAADAAFFDAPPATCPAFGELPRFANELEQAIFQPCTSFSIASTGDVLASCTGVIHEGRLGAPLLPAAGLESTPGMTLRGPRIHPDGNSAAVLVQSGASTLAIYTRTLGGWTKQATISLPYAPYNASAPSRNGRMLVLGNGVHELAQDPSGTWRELRTIPFSELAIASISEPITLGADGLRLVAAATIAGSSGVQLVYADRRTIDEPFSHARPLAPIDYAPNGQLTEDCGRIYIASLGSVFYAPLITTPPP